MTECSGHEGFVALLAEALQRVGTGHHPHPPGAVIQIPVDGFLHAAFEGFLRRPAQRRVDFSGIDRVAFVMARTILDEGDQVAEVRNIRRLFRAACLKQIA